MSRLRHSLAVGGFLLSVFVAFLTYGRATWLAALVVVAGLLVVHGRALAHLGIAIIPVLALVVGSGLFDAQIQTAESRFMSDQSEESALSRLPVVVASLRMYEAKPLTGWGYGNFDLYDRQFQTAIDDVYVPEKDHASHNLYLTIMAEQGTPGIVLYLGPAIAVAVAAFRRRKGLPETGFISQQLLWVLVLCLAAHFTVNNFSNMRIVYGLGLWWITVALLASVSDSAVSNGVTGDPPAGVARIPLAGLVARAKEDSS